MVFWQSWCKMSSVYSVSQISSYIKNMFDMDFALNSVYVKGEVSNCKYHSTGHIYFSIKDKDAVLHAVMFKNYRDKGLKFLLKEGQKVIVLGRISTYERSGNYQMYASEIVLDGTGVLYQKYEQLKQELEEMGYFSDEYKRPIPRYAKKIGIVTAKTGAAIQDICNIAKRRNPYVQLYLYPATVQGDGAARTIVSGIRCLDDMNLDIIIVGRGGGSIEDLWAFNEEEVAKAIFEANTPIISAVGHEVDFTIADYVADLRAPTPSAAAELAVFDYHIFQQELMHQKKDLRDSIMRILNQNKNRIQMQEKSLKFVSPSNQIQMKRMYSSELYDQIENKMQQKIRNRRHQLELLCEKLSALSPIDKIRKGYGYLTNTDGKAIKSIQQIKDGEEFYIQLGDGRIKAKTLWIEQEDSLNG